MSTKTQPTLSNWQYVPGADHHYATLGPVLLVVRPYAGAAEWVVSVSGGGSFSPKIEWRGLSASGVSGAMLPAEKAAPVILAAWEALQAAMGRV